MIARQTDGGYTLVELLASLVVLALIGSMIASGITTGRRVWEHADTSLAALDTVAGAQMVLRNRLETAFPQTKYDGIAPYAYFDGAPSQVKFLAPPEDAHKPAPLWRYSLNVDASGDLVLSSVSDLAVHNALPENVVLLRGVQSFDVAYFGAAPPDNIPQWRPGWQSRPSLPQLVRIRVQFAQSDKRWWPDLIVKPVATVDSACALNTQTNTCRGRI